MNKDKFEVPLKEIRCAQKVINDKTNKKNCIAFFIQKNILGYNIFAKLNDGFQLCIYKEVEEKQKAELLLAQLEKWIHPFVDIEKAL
ncbi:MAG: hypothetical protein ACOCQR_03630 [bacterium]